MAISLDQLRNLIVTGWYGRRDGLDANDFEVGPKDLRTQVQDINTTAATTVYNYGYTNLMCTAASSAVYTIPAPTVGIFKTIVQTCTSTLGYAVQAPSGVNFVTTAGSSFNQVVFQGIGQTGDLIALTTAKYAIRAGAAGSGMVASTY